jgi:hypothetical protein
MNDDRRSGSPVLRRKLDRPTNGGPPIGRLITLGAIGAIALGMVGVVVAASVPSIDLFGIYASRQNATTAASTPEKKSPSTTAPPAPEPLPITRGQEAPPAPRPRQSFNGAGTDEAPAVRNSGAEDPDPNGQEANLGPSGADKPDPMAQSGDRSIDRDAIYLKDLHPAIDLPATNDVGETTLSYLQDAAKIAFADVALMADVAVLGERQEFVFDREGTKPSWTISLIDPEHSGGRVPLAVVWCFQSSVMFHWLPDAGDVPEAEQIRNTAIRFTVGTSHQYMALRKPTPLEVHTLDLSDRTNEIAATIANPPKPESLYIEVIGARQMPINAHYEKELAIVPVPLVETPDPAVKKGSKAPPKNGANATPPSGDAPAPSRVTILFDNLNDGEQPQLWIDASQKAPGEVEIEIAAKILRGKIVNDLTTNSLELYRVPRDQQIANVEREWKNAHDRIVTIDKTIGEIRAGKPDVGVSIRSLQTRQLQAQREYERLDKEIKRIKAELAWVNAASIMVQSLDGHAQLKYRVFAKSGDFELDLIRVGLD